jgi:hypothetical protein
MGGGVLSLTKALHGRLCICLYISACYAFDRTELNKKDFAQAWCLAMTCQRILVYMVVIQAKARSTEV